MKRALALTSLVNRAAGRTVTLEQGAARTETLEHAWREVRPRPLHLPGMLERATGGVPGFSHLAGERAIAERDHEQHDALIRYELTDCLVTPGGVVTSDVRLKFGRDGPRPFLFRRLQETDRAIWCDSHVSRRFFGHWLADACPTALLARADETVLMTTPPDWTHAGDYLGLFGLKAEQPGLRFVRRLALFRDHAQGRSKRRRFATLRQRLVTSLGLQRRAERDIYFRRGTTGVARLVENEEQVVGTLERQGFDVLDHAGLTAAQIARRVARARCVVTMEGSHVNHLHYAMPRGASLVVMTPADRFTMLQFGFACAVGLRYGLLVLRPGRHGYFVDTDELSRTLDLVRRGGGDRATGAAPPVVSNTV